MLKYVLSERNKKRYTSDPKKWTVKDTDLFYDIAGMTDSDKLREYANHPDSYVRETVARNDYTPVDALEVLCGDENEYVRENVAGNINATTEMLRRLSEDKNESVKKKAIHILGLYKENPEVMEGFRREFDKERTEKETKKTQERELKMEENIGIPLEEQLARAISEERYEDARKIQEQLTKFKKLVSSRCRGRYIEVI